MRGQIPGCVVDIAQVGIAVTASARRSAHGNKYRVGSGHCLAETGGKTEPAVGHVLAHQVGKATAVEDLHTIQRAAFDKLVHRCQRYTPEELAKRYGLPFAEAAPGAVGVQTLLPAAMRLYHAGGLSLPQLWRALAQLGLDPENAGAATELRDLARRERPELAGLAQSALDAMQAVEQEPVSQMDASLWIAEAQAARDPQRELQGRLVRAQVWLAQEKTEEARQDARIAAQLAAELLQPVAHAQARRLVAQVLTGQGLYQQARAELWAAQELAERAGVARIVKACGEWLAQIDEAELASR